MLAAYDVDGRKSDHFRDSIGRAIKYGVETYAELLSDEKYAPLKTAFDEFLSDQAVPDVKELLPIVGADDPSAATKAWAKAYAARALTSLIAWSKHVPTVEESAIDELEDERAAWKFVDATSKTKIDQTIQKMVESIGVSRSGTPRGGVEKSEPPTIFVPSTVKRKKIEPLTEPLPEWTVERVPEDARMVPVQFGPLKQVGYRVEPTELTAREMLVIETYRTIDEPVKSECRFYIEGKSTRENDNCERRFAD